MERPQSQLENQRPSGLKPPGSRLPALSRPLQETTNSDLNARTASASASVNENVNGSVMRPQNGYSIVPSKHKVEGLPGPPPKRKTLADRAGEPLRSHIPGKSSISSISNISNGFGSRPKSNADYYRNPANTAIASSSSTNGIRPTSKPMNGVSRYPAPRAVKSSFNLKAQAQHDDHDSDGETSVMGRRDAFDTNVRLDSMEKMFNQMKGEMAMANTSKEAIEMSLELYKSQAAELQNEKRELASQCKTLSTDLERARTELHTTTTDLRQVRRDHERELHDLERKHDKEMSDLRLKQEREESRTEREREKEAARFAREIEEAKRAWEKEKDRETAEMTTEHWDELDKIRTAHEKELAELRSKVHDLEQAGESRATESASEVQLLRETVASTQSQLDASNATIVSLRSRITTFEARISTLEQEKNNLVSKAHFLEGNQEAQSQEFTVMQAKMEEAIAAKEVTMETLRKEEALRRKLNATILELRGNIRVFVRTRPLLNGEDDPAKVDYIDEDSLEGCKEMVVHAPITQTATGKQRNEKHQYEFDRCFAPGTPNPSVFDECRDLIQSVVDGYNVSILSYGQTGSGKTYGMTGPKGIIPSSIRMLLSEMGRLKEKGWEYAVEANFVEVYNETLNDLLGDAKTWDETDDLGASVRGKKKEKHEIHHDAATGKTTVTNLTTIGLWPPPSDDGNWPPPAPVQASGEGDEESFSYTEKAVANLLDTAAKNRRVAATKANERSSRSHSIFMLTLKGSCAASGQHSEGVLNLVDLAGSERLKQSGAEGSRMKETQAINKSLSSLGDVIAALGNKSGNSEAHVPYRNSKLTYLLQSSLGGTTAGKSSRTLMLLHLSPLQAHWQESRSSLLFGSKVHGTHIGTAKKK